MSFSQGARTGLIYAPQTDFDTVATTGFKSLPYATHSLNMAKARVQGTDLQPDRMERHDRHGTRDVAGDMVFDLRAGEYDDFLEAAMFSTWDSTPTGPDELKIGVTPKYFTVRDQAEDIVQSREFSGLSVSQASFALGVDSNVTTTLSLVGKDMTTSQTIVTSTPSSLNVPFDTHSGTIEIGDNGGALTEAVTITSFNFSINNTMTSKKYIGSRVASCLGYEKAMVEGTFTAYYKDLALVDRFIDEVESAISVTVNDPTGNNAYSFYFPRVKFNDAGVPVTGATDRIVTVPFVALFDPTENTNLLITRPDST